jgi:hypothetical protein
MKINLIKKKIIQKLQILAAKIPLKQITSSVQEYRIYLVQISFKKINRDPKHTWKEIINFLVSKLQITFTKYYFTKKISKIYLTQDS